MHVTRYSLWLSPPISEPGLCLPLVGAPGPCLVLGMRHIQVPRLDYAPDTSVIAAQE
jgi:hypothetical protein